MQRRTLMIVGAALTSVVFMPAALAADGLPYDAKGDPFAFVVDLSNAVLDRIRSSEALKSGNVDSLRKLVDEIVLPATDFTMMTRMTSVPNGAPQRQSKRRLSRAALRRCCCAYMRAVLRQ